jgi:hypothetical protein
LRAIQPRGHYHDRPEIGGLGRRSPYSPGKAPKSVKMRVWGVRFAASGAGSHLGLLELERSGVEMNAEGGAM